MSPLGQQPLMEWQFAQKKKLNNTLMERPNFLAVGGIRMCKQSNLLDIKRIQSFKAAGV